MECIFDVAVILIRRAFACLDKPGPKSRAVRSVVMVYCVLIARGIYPMKYVHGCVLFCFVTIISLQWRHNGPMASQITSLTIVYLNVYSGADQRKHQSSASLDLVRGIHRRQMNFPHKWPVTRKMFPFWWRHHVLQWIHSMNISFTLNLWCTRLWYIRGDTWHF